MQMSVIFKYLNQKCTIRFKTTIKIYKNFMLRSLRSAFQLNLKHRWTPSFPDADLTCLIVSELRTFLHRLQSHHHLVMVFIPFYRNVYEWKKKRFEEETFQTRRQISWWIITLKHEWNGTRSKKKRHRS